MIPLSRQEVNRNLILSVERERVALGYTQAQMADALEMSLSGYKKLVGGETERIDIYVVYRLSELTGKFFYELAGRNLGNINYISCLRELSDSQNRFIGSIVDFERDFREKHPADYNDFLSVLVLTGDMKDGMIYDSCNVEKVPIGALRKKYGESLTCGIRVTSNHLHPVYHRDDILLVSKQPPRDGDIGIFISRESNRAYLRKFRQTNPCRLEPVNDYGETFLVNPEKEEDMNRWIKFGKVLAKTRL
ncbi:MAG: DNA-binding protein [Lachnospiraceae bacterium]|nr:DNA-binding protein [Lachnospiraceae bacterium]